MPIVVLLSLPIFTGLAVVLYERITLRSGLTIGQYIVLSNLMYLIPVLIWCFVKGELTASSLRVPWTAYWKELSAYSLLSILVSVCWWYSSRLAGVTLSSAFESSYPIFVLMFSVLWNNQPVTVREVASILVIALGLVLLRTA
ncbi:hypothetical protein [Paludibaculum fermentans]|uniref:hypothetical protein n=1 Tax=Paludibaculum fermentans TaxID=1473598 RepID=UPI003EBE5C82